MEIKNYSQAGADPYATPAHRRINLLLLLISVIIIYILLLSGSHGQAANSVTQRSTAEKINARPQ